MATGTSQSRSLGPIILGALAVLLLFPTRAEPRVRLDRIRVDPGRDAPFLLESLEGMGREGSTRIVCARKGLLPIDAPGDLMTVPGIGTRLLHRWHAELEFRTEAP